MDTRRLKGGRGGTPQFVKPYLNTLNEMRVQNRLRPDQLNRRAEELLWETFGTDARPIESAFAHGSLDLMAEHVRYFDGFALMMPLAEGCSVAVRAGAPDAVEHKVAAANDEAVQWAREALDVLEGGFVEAAVVNGLPDSLANLGQAPAMVATARAAGALGSRTTTEEEDLATLAQRKGPDRHVLTARIKASIHTNGPAFVLVDPREDEAIGLEIPVAERPGLALVQLPTVDDVTRGENRKLLREATAALKRYGFGAIHSVRDVEHRDLERALGVVDKRDRPLVTYLVTENGRVQRMVAAIQRRDWQMFGALLVMSHASKRAGLGLGDAGCDHIVEEIENMSLDGMYGATRLDATSRSVMVTGQLFSVPPALDRLRASFEERFSETPKTLLF